VRLLPLPINDTCFTERIVGSADFAGMLDRLGVDRLETVEGGRWIVDPSHRVSRLGARLAAGGVALARALGYRLLCCPVGTGRKQDQVLARLGIAAAPNLPVVPVPAFDDALRVMYVFPHQPGPRLRELVDRMTLELELPAPRCVRPGRSEGVLERPTVTVGRDSPLSP
jgi:hypothetical protein